MIEDTHNDLGTGDYFWFTFDLNRNKAITPRYDVNYGNYRGNPNKNAKTILFMSWKMYRFIERTTKVRM